MKRLIYALGMMGIILLAGCRTNGVVVDSDYSYNGTFQDYKSFSFLENNVMGLDDDHVDKVKSMVSKRLTSLGYEPQRENPDLLITFKYFTEGMRMRGYQQTKLDSWVIIRKARPEEKDEDRYNSNKVNLPPGSLVLYLLDNKSRELVWVGYSSIDLAMHDRNLSASVGMIMDRYTLARY